MSDLPTWLQPLAAKARDIDASDLSRFPPPVDGSGRQSAVLMAFAETSDGPGILLIERAADLRKHPGQVAFPGGSLDPGETPAHAALREADEEVGLNARSVHVVAELPAIYIPVSGFVVTPVLAWWEQPHEVSAVDAGEVALVALIPVAELANPANRFTVTHPTGYVGPAFEAGGLFVWGFTAGLVDRLLTFGGWAQPWDQTLRRPLPPALMGR
ncbi:MAG TPA: CoA pyrophosphatase [Jatrophihabitans sp.]|nr:CoA pyrophosphatase [Jatrophihabitans sp.]